MHLYFLCFVLAVTTVHTHGSHQIQMPEAGAFTVDEDAAELLERLRHNVSVLWTEFGQLRTVLTETLTHLRVHQAELEETVHRLEHKHDENVDSHGSFTDDHHHHHSGEAHSHGDDSHSHGDDSHSHGGDSHSHGGDSHSHGDDDHHHHSGEQHSHSGEQHSHGSEHSHSGESHSHGDGHHESWSRSHSHQLGSSHSGHEMQEHHQHGDSYENGNDLQQAQQGADAIVEPLVVATSSQQHYHHSHQYPHMASANNLQLINDSSFYRHHHHHQHSQYVQSRSQRNRTVVVPKYSEYNLYDFAVCNVLPNRAIPESQQQEIIGRVNLWQKKTGGPLNIHVRLQGFDMGDHHQHHDAQQSIQQEEDNEPPIGHKHGFHIHDSGDMSNGCQSTGPHYNPKSMNHGGPNALVRPKFSGPTSDDLIQPMLVDRHVGDLGNIECDDHGTVNIVFNDEIASLKGPYSIVGRAIVIHSGPDDYGLGGNEESLRTGNAGTRLACCVIEKVEKLPIRSYKYIKAATPYEN